MLKEARKEANLTQEQLAEKTGQKQVISTGSKMQEGIFSYQPLSGFLKKDLYCILVKMRSKFSLRCSNTDAYTLSKFANLFIFGITEKSD